MASGQHAVGKDGDVVGGGEESGVSGDATHEAGVLVVNPALDDAMAEGLVVDGGWNLLAPLCGRAETCAGHAEGAEDFFLAEIVERLVGDAAEDSPKMMKPMSEYSARVMAQRRAA